MVNNDIVTNVLTCKRRFSSMYVERVYIVRYAFEWNVDS